jgi:hypothetical protein
VWFHPNTKGQKSLHLSPSLGAVPLSPDANSQSGLAANVAFHQFDLQRSTWESPSGMRSDRRTVCFGSNYAVDREDPERLGWVDPSDSSDRIVPISVMVRRGRRPETDITEPWAGRDRWTPTRSLRNRAVRNPTFSSTGDAVACFSPTTWASHQGMYEVPEKARSTAGI